ncbi:MAG: hypothetical protein Q4D65_02215 [Peptostreptococcaceae bacterium]|nr:hypothetical protein [Peptostreptococcaceae bacterium]
MSKDNQLFFTILYIFCGIMLLRSIQKAFFTKLEQPSDYMKRANYAVSFFKARNYANNLLQKALDRFDNLTEEELSFIHFQMGYNYFDKRNFEQAAKHFELSWPFLKKAKISYNKGYASLVVAFYNIGQKEKAREIYHYLRKKESYDPRFAALEYLERSIFK